MILYKTDQEIELIKQSCRLVSQTLEEVAKWIKPGIKTIYLDKIAEEFIRSHGAIPGFLNYNGYPNTLCVSVNEQIVHGIPSSYILKEGDIASVDCGVLMNEYYGDSAYTFAVGEISQKVANLLKVTKEALYKGIELAREGKRIGDIGFSIQQHVEQNGYSVVRELVGHGIGKNLHEKPQVPNYGRRGKGTILKEGLVIAIEPMINLGKKNVIQSDDGWTFSTFDGLPSAHFEHTIAIQHGKTEILSDFKDIEKQLNTIL